MLVANNKVDTAHTEQWAVGMIVTFNQRRFYVFDNDIVCITMYIIKS